MTLAVQHNSARRTADSRCFWYCRPCGSGTDIVIQRHGPANTKLNPSSICFSLWQTSWRPAICRHGIKRLRGEVRRPLRSTINSLQILRLHRLAWHSSGRHLFSSLSTSSKNQQKQISMWGQVARGPSGTLGGIAAASCGGPGLATPNA